MKATGARQVASKEQEENNLAQTSTLAHTPSSNTTQQGTLKHVSTKSESNRVAMMSQLTRVEIQVSGHQVKTVIGKGGRNLQKIKEFSQVRKIEINHKDEFVLTGSESAVERAKVLINQIAVGDESGIGHTKETLTIDSKHVQEIIGKKGAAIKSTQESTGAYIEVQTSEVEGESKVIMTGPTESARLAKLLMQGYSKNQMGNS